MLGNKESQLGQRIVAWGAPTWVRPEEWIPLPELEVGQERLVGLYRVNNAANQCVAFTVSGAYTVDWGDGGAPENFNAGAKAEHTYDFAAVDPETETPEGWRQAIISITPQPGATLTGINLTSVHSIGAGNYTSWWLDVAVVGAGLTSCLCGGAAGASLKPLSNMRRFQFIGTNSIANFSGMFYGCSSLQSVPLFDTSSGTSFYRMFQDCSSLQSVPLFDTSSGTDFSGMFYGCSSLQSVPLFDTSSGTNFGYMFYDCSSLQSVPLFDTSSGTNFGGMFRGCSSLQSVPLFDTSSGTDFGYMFQGCTILYQGALAGTRFTISYVNCRLDRAAIVAVFNALGTAVPPAQTITVTGNPGVPYLTPEDIAIATDKGWAVAA